MFGSIQLNLICLVTMLGMGVRVKDPGLARARPQRVRSAVAIATTI